MDFMKCSITAEGEAVVAKVSIVVGIEVEGLGATEEKAAVGDVVASVGIAAEEMVNAVDVDVADIGATVAVEMQPHRQACGKSCIPCHQGAPGSIKQRTFFY